MTKPAPKDRGARRPPGARRTADLLREIERLSARLEEAERSLRSFGGRDSDGGSGTPPAPGEPGAPGQGSSAAQRPIAVARAGAAVPVPLEEMESSLRERTRELTVMNRELLEEIRERFAVEEELRRSESRFRAIYEYAPVGIALLDMRDRFVAVNPELERMLGVPADELRGRRFNRFLPPGAKLPRHRIYIELVRRKQPVFDSELRWVKKGGEGAWARIRLSLFDQSPDARPLFLCTVVDVTTQKGFEAALRANVRRQSAVAEIGRQALAGADLAEVARGAVSSVARILRVPLCGLMELNPDGSGFVLRAGVGFGEGTVGTYQAGRGTGSQSGYTLLAGEPVTVDDLRVDTRFTPSRMLIEHGARSGISVPISGREGEPFGVLGIYDTKPRMYGSEEVAFLESAAQVLGLFVEHTRLREELARAEARYRTLVETLPVAIFVVQDGRIVFRNREQATLFGATPPGADLRGALRVHPEDGGKAEEFFAAMDSGRAATFRADLRILPAGESGGKKVRWVHCQGSPILHEGSPACLVSAIDVTRSKELEQLVLVREKLASLGVISAGIAHEIRNPLSGMNIYVSALEHLCDQSGDLDPATKEKIQVISDQLAHASDKISSVIRGIMDFSRPASLALGPVDLNEVVAEAVRLCGTTIRLQRVELETSLSPDLPRVTADRMLIGQVVVNLITNALQAMEKEGAEAPKRLKIATSEEEDMAWVKVSDSGEGVPPHLREQIFDPFFTTRRDGYGIGLSFCRRVVEDHRGMLSVDTSEWRGAEFRISLPLGTDPAAP